MKFCYQINSQEVLLYAQNLVQSANKEIVVTMNIDEEMKTPLPDSYHKLLITRAKHGIVITRHGYGSEKNLKKLIRPKEINFVFHGNIEKYQRMLIVDNKKGLFKLSDRVYYSEFKPLILSLVKYTKIKYTALALNYKRV